MDSPFEWDAVKAAANLRKHGVSFGEAATVFADPLSRDILDGGRSGREERFVCIGRSYLGRLLVVGYTERGPRIRIINARRANPREARAYEKANGA